VGGGPGGRSGGNTGGAAWPQDQSQIKHIFGNRSGHMADTPANRARLEQMVKDPANKVSDRDNGVERYAQIQSDGTELWADVRYGVLQNGGLNTVPRNTR
jgi:filamentous hemagglutinin